MKKYQYTLVRVAIAVVALRVAPVAHAACDLTITSAGPCLANGSAGNPAVGDSYGITATFDIKGAPSAPFNILFTMANVSYTISNLNLSAGNGYRYYDSAAKPLPPSRPASFDAGRRGLVTLQV